MSPARRPRGRPHAPTDPGAAKQPFDIDLALRRIRAAVRAFPRAALFELAEEGFTSVFEQVVACIISVRTRDETTLVVARRLLARARTPAQMGTLGIDEIDRLIHPCTFHEDKAKNLLAIVRLAQAQHGGELPCDADALLALPGVGPKCAGLL
jgi:endonuclease-3